MSHAPVSGYPIAGYPLFLFAVYSCTFLDVTWQSKVCDKCLSI